MKKILLLLLLFSLKSFAQCPIDSIKPINSNTFKIYWNNKITKGNIKITLSEKNTNKTKHISVFDSVNKSFFRANIKANKWELTGITPKKNGSCNNPVALPVELLYFKKENLYLKWATATETNNNFFVVQHYSKGNWESITKIYSKADDGTSVKKLKYRYHVNKKGYYRLKQVDFDGSYEYSDVIKVNTQTDQSKLYNFYNLQGIKIFRGTKKSFCSIFDKGKLYFYKNDEGRVSKITIR